MSDQTEVATKVEELSTTLNVDIEDVTITIEDGGLGETVISGADVAEYLTEGEDESDESDDIIEDDEDTTEGGDDVDIHFEEMDYTDIQKLASEKLEEYPDDSSRQGLIEALQGNIEDVEVSSTEEDDQTPTESEPTTEGGDEDTISDSELIEMGVSEGNLEKVRKYRSKNGICSEGDCPYGANDGEDFCASHQGSSSKSKTSSSSSSKKVSYDDLTSGQQKAARNLLEEKEDEEDFGLEEAVQMV